MKEEDFVEEKGIKIYWQENGDHAVIITENGEAYRYRRGYRQYRIIDEYLMGEKGVFEENSDLFEKYKRIE